MNTETIRENNKLIALFLGWEEQTNKEKRWYGSFKTPGQVLYVNTSVHPLMFHCDWNWLMMVVEEIVKKEHIGIKEVFELLNEEEEKLNNISDVYDTIIKFIRK